MVEMGATSQTPHLSLDLGTVSSDTSVWNPSGLNIFVDLGVLTGLENAIPSCPSSVQGHLIVDIGDHGCQEVLDVQSEPRTSLDSASCQLRPGHVEEPVLHEERYLLSGCGIGEYGRTNDTNGETNAKICAEKGGTSNADSEYSTEKVLSKIVDTDHDTDVCSASSSFWKDSTSTDGPVRDDGNPNSLSAYTVFGIEGLNEEDILAACQLLELSHEGIGEIVDETFAAYRLLELSACYSCNTNTDGEKSDDYWDDFHGRSLKCHSAPLDSFCTDLACDVSASTSAANDNLDQEHDPWDGGGQHGNWSDLRTPNSKRMKPYKHSSYGESEKDDDDWDILDRPPHKRQYRSLRHMYERPPSSSYKAKCIIFSAIHDKKRK